MLKYLGRSVKRLARSFRRKVHAFLNRNSFFHIDDFTRPYICEKSVEGVDFLLHITDRDSRLWYDLYSTDPAWPEMKFIKDNLVKPGDVVIECGSHHGCTTILLSKWVGPSGRVFAYEPSGKNYDTLQRNLALNNIGNVTEKRAVVGDCAGFVEFVEDDDSSMGSFVLPEKESAYKVSMRTEQVALDVHAADKPSLIKIDTQGYVYEPLLGSKNLINDQRPHLALEIDSKSAIDKYGDNFSKIFDLISHEDYIYFVSFVASEQPSQINLPDLINEWKKRNNLTKDIHLFAQNYKKNSR